MSKPQIMPYIQENHLLDFHKNLDKSNTERDLFEDHYQKELAKNEKLRIERKKLLRFSSFLIVLITAGITTYFLNFNALNIGAKSGNEMAKQSSTNSKKSEGLKTNTNLYESEFPKEFAYYKSSLGTIALPDTASKTSKPNTLFYAVQVAASKKRLLSFLLNESNDIKEILEKGYYKYSYGNFNTLKEAQILRKELLKSGYKDAFVASFKNNKRLKIEQAW